LAAYRAGEWAEAIAELRAARRMGGGPGHLAVLADCERALGRPERALDLARGPEAGELDEAEAIELRIVAAGARRDMGEVDAAVVSLQIPELDPAQRRPWSARLFYAYADALLAAGRRDEAVRWFLHAADADDEELTDAAERLTELIGPEPDEPVRAGGPAESDQPGNSAEFGERPDEPAPVANGRVKPASDDPIERDATLRAPSEPNSGERARRDAGWPATADSDLLSSTESGSSPEPDSKRPAVAESEHLSADESEQPAGGGSERAAAGEPAGPPEIAGSEHSAGPASAGRSAS
jgi:tetratricopeptide (TPR) repeat protein